MEKDIRESIALKRFEIISPVLAEPARAQNEYFRQQAEREHHFPRYGLRKVRVSTMKTWLKKYRKKGSAHKMSACAVQDWEVYHLGGENESA